MLRLRTGNRELIKDLNRNLVLNLIKNRGPISRTQIAKEARLSMATVSGVTATLLKNGLIQPVGQGESSGGRKPVLLRLDSHAGYVVGLKVTEHRLICALTDLDANVVHRSTFPFDAAPGVKAALDSTAQAIRTVVLESGINLDKVIGVGIGLSGVIDGEAGICRYSAILGWRDVKISGPLEKRLKLPVYVDNDVNTLTIAEQWFGYGREHDHFLVVTIGRGIGMGMVVNGQFYRGAFGGAGEFGHTTMGEDGPLCDCGKRGCLEAWAADPAVVRLAVEAAQRGESPGLARLLEESGDGLTLDLVASAAEGGDRTAREILARSGYRLGVGIANLVSIFNPQLVIVGGEGVRAGEFRLGPMREAIRQHAFNGLAQGLEIIIEPSGDDAWARGAASLVLGEVFKSPIYRGEQISLLAS